jgi:hypothetical protein
MMSELIKNPSNIFGLKWIPSINNDDADRDGEISDIYPPVEFSEENQKYLKEYFLKIRDKCKCIVEIGICRNRYDLTSTSILIDNKLPETVYIGIDLEDKQFLVNANNNVFTIKGNSFDRQACYSLMKSLDIDKIDFLFIDGWHSINTVINDWQYTEKLSDFGIVGFHDTNKHPGPLYVFDAIDETIFDKFKYLEGQNDWGISFTIKK